MDREPSSFFLMINFVLQFLGFSVLIFVLHFEVGLVFFLFNNTLMIFVPLNSLPFLLSSVFQKVLLCFENLWFVEWVCSSDFFIGAI